jgi:hypothetical protein
MADHGTPSSAHDVTLNSGHNSTNTPGTAGNAPASARSVKRPRPVKSCIECRNRKLKCDRLLPCSQCQKSSRNCRYAADGDVNNLSEGSDVEAPEKQPKKRCLTNNFEAASSSPRPRDRTATVPIGILEEHSARLERLEKIVMSSIRSPPGREFNFNRAPPLASSSTTMRGLTVKGGLRTRFFGQNSTRVLLNLVSQTLASPPNCH